jgi:hypothetical protein
MRKRRKSTTEGSAVKGDEPVWAQKRSYAAFHKKTAILMLSPNVFSPFDRLNGNGPTEGKTVPGEPAEA